MLGARWPQTLVPAACGILALVAVLLALIPALRPVGWDVTALPRVADNTGMGAAAQAKDPGFHTVHIGAYDGQFYWGIAVDPIATGDVHQSFDTASYRYGHPLLGWLGWLLSAGQARAAPAALLGVGLVSLVVGAVAASLLGQAFGRRGWEGMFVAANPGLLYASVHDLAEPLSAALLVGGLLLYVRSRRLPAAVCFGLLVLSKEQFVLVPLALAIWELVRVRVRVRAAFVLVAPILPVAGWWVYARLQLGAWFTSGTTALAFPLSGWKRSLLDAGIGTYSPDGALNISDEATLVILAGLLVLLALGGIFAIRLRGPTDAAYLAIGVVAVCLAPNATTLLRDAIRNTSVLLTLVPFVIASLPLPPMWRARRGGGSSRERQSSPT
jgi:hypothetical protein